MRLYYYDGLPHHHVWLRHRRRRIRRHRSHQPRFRLTTDNLFVNRLYMSVCVYKNVSGTRSEYNILRTIHNMKQHNISSGVSKSSSWEGAILKRAYPSTHTNLPGHN